MVKHPAGCLGPWIYYLSVVRSSHIAPSPATHRIPAPAALNPWELSWDVTFAIHSWSLIPAEDQKMSIPVIFSLYCSALAPSLHLLTSQKTSGCLGTRSTPGHVSMMPDGKARAFRSTMTTNLLYTSLMWPSLPTPRTTREEQVSDSSLRRDVECCACFCSAWTPALKQHSSKVMEKAKLQCHYQPVITSPE